MQAAVGRIVIYHFAESDQWQNYAHPDAPAIIVWVWSDTSVNLKVLTDGHSDLWKMSIEEGTGPNQWSWPLVIAPKPID